MTTDSTDVREGDVNMAGVTIVVGALGGIGRAIAQVLAQEAEGQMVVIDRPEEMARLRELASELSCARKRVEPIGVDVRDIDGVTRVFHTCVSEAGEIDTVVNAAGGGMARLVAQKDCPLYEISRSQWDTLIDANLGATFNLIHAASKVMIPKGHGHVIIIASGNGLRPLRYKAAYAASKAGVIGLVKAAAVDLGQFGLQVNAINPGLTPHSQLQREMFGGSYDDYLSSTTLGRVSNVGDTASFVLLLTRLTNVSGQVFSLDSRLV